MLRAVTYITVL